MKNKNISIWFSRLFFTHSIPKTLFSLVLVMTLLGGCTEEPVLKEAEFSLIYPPSLLIADLQAIKLISPNNGETYYIDDRDVNDLTFKFDGTAPYFASLILFKDQPTVSKEGYIVDGKAQCFGGVSNMSLVHRWNGTSSVLSVDLDKSVFYTCNNESITDAFSETEKLILDETTLSKNTAIYWAVLGYNDRYTLTHASPLRKINIQ